MNIQAIQGSLHVYGQRKPIVVNPRNKVAEAGISHQYGYLLERGQRQPTFAVAQRIAAEFGRRLECWEADA